jgi:hypothetical protein
MHVGHHAHGIAVNHVHDEVRKPSCGEGAPNALDASDRRDSVRMGARMIRHAVPQDLPGVLALFAEAKVPADGVADHSGRQPMGPARAPSLPPVFPPVTYDRSGRFLGFRDQQ